MNKRIKIKKRILKKECGKGCVIFNVIVGEKLITNNACIGCKYKQVTDEICKKNLECNR